MTKFRKLPVVIEATQWFKDGDHPAVLTAPLDPMTAFRRGRHGWIQTLEGGHIVTPGDWIITGVHGEMYPCKDEIFRLTYEPVGAGPCATKEEGEQVKKPIPTQEEIDAVFDRCVENEEEGDSEYPGASYEQGVMAAIRWLTEGDTNPMED